MDLNDLKSEVVIEDGQKYEFNMLDEPIDLTEQNKGVKTYATHVVEGFPEKLLLVIEEYKDMSDEGNFYFAHIVGETGLVVDIKDEDIYLKASSLLLKILER